MATNFDKFDRNILVSNLQELFLYTENSGNTSTLYKFSFAGGNSAYSFGVLQADVGHNDQAKAFLFSIGFTSAQVAELSKNGGISNGELANLNQLLASHQTAVDQFMASLLDQKVNRLDQLINILKDTNPSAAQSILSDKELQLRILDFDNQFGISGLGGSAASQNGMLKFLEGNPINAATGVTLQLQGTGLSATDIEHYISNTLQAIQSPSDIQRRSADLQRALDEIQSSPSDGGGGDGIDVSDQVDADGNVSSTVVLDDVTLVTVYDQNGEIQGSYWKDESGVVTSRSTYDVNGNLLSSYRATEMGSVEIVNEGDGSVRSTQYDANDAVLSVSLTQTDMQGVVTTTTTNFDPATGAEVGHSVGTNDGQGNTTTSVYGQDGSLNAYSWATPDGGSGNNTYRPDGTLAGETWRAGDGSYGTNTYGEGGVLASSTWHSADGNSGTNTYDQNGALVSDTWHSAAGSDGTDTYRADGTRAADTWQSADGSHGTNTYNLDGSSSSTNVSADGSADVINRDGQGDLLTQHFDPTGVMTGDSWTHADGSHGTDTFNADGSSSGTTVNADNTSSRYEDDGRGDRTTTSFDAAGVEMEASVTTTDAQGNVTTNTYSEDGRLEGDSWSHTDGSHGSDHFDTDGSSSGETFNADGSHTSYYDHVWYTDSYGYTEEDRVTISYGSDGSVVSVSETDPWHGTVTQAVASTAQTDDGEGNITITNYAADGSRISDTWTHADGSHGTDVYSHDEYSSSISGTLTNADGSSSAYWNATTPPNDWGNSVFYDITTQYNRDGTSSSTEVDAWGNQITVNFDATGTRISETDADSYGDLNVFTFGPNGSYTELEYYQGELEATETYTVTLRADGSTDTVETYQDSDWWSRYESVNYQDGSYNQNRTSSDGGSFVWTYDASTGDSYQSYAYGDGTGNSDENRTNADGSHEHIETWTNGYESTQDDTRTYLDGAVESSGSVSFAYKTPYQPDTSYDNWTYADGSTKDTTTSTSDGATTTRIATTSANGSYDSKVINPDGSWLDGGYDASARTAYYYSYSDNDSLRYSDVTKTAANGDTTEQIIVPGQYTEEIDRTIAGLYSYSKESEDGSYVHSFSSGGIHHEDSYSAGTGVSIEVDQGPGGDFWSVAYDDGFSYSETTTFADDGTYTAEWSASDGSYYNASYEAGGDIISVDQHFTNASDANLVPENPFGPPSL